MLEHFKKLSYAYNSYTGELDNGLVVERRLSQLKGCFANESAYDQALANEDSLLYKVTAIEPAHGEGDLHYGMGILYPGKIGNEYYLTKGHLHRTRQAAEIYIGLSGDGCMLLEDEQTGESRLEYLGKNKIVYVPGYTAHRTINIGTEPLTYFGVYPANAGHDYGAIAQRNFLKILVDENGQPTLKDRR